MNEWSVTMADGSIVVVKAHSMAIECGAIVFREGSALVTRAIAAGWLNCELTKSGTGGYFSRGA